MTRFEAALIDLVSFLDEEKTPYMMIGGVANLHWGTRRFTEDLDLVVRIADEDVSSWLGRVAKRFRMITSDLPGFLRRNHFIQIETQSGVPADVMVAVLPYQWSAIERAVPVPVAGCPVRFCTAEDLVIHKLASERPLDHADVEGVVLRQGERLDRAYLDRHVRDLAAGLERPEVLSFYDACLKKAGLKGLDHHG